MLKLSFKLHTVIGNKYLQATFTTYLLRNMFSDNLTFHCILVINLNLFVEICILLFKKKGLYYYIIGLEKGVVDNFEFLCNLPI